MFTRLRPLVLNALVTSVVAIGVSAYATRDGVFLPQAAHFIFFADGTCPAGWAEEADYDGKMIRLTRAIHGDVGTTGGADSILPAGTNSTSTVTATGTVAWPVGVPTHTGTTATFSGNALSATTFAIPTGSGAFKGTGTGGFSTVGGAAPGSAGATTSKSPGTPSGSVTITSQGAVAWPAGVPIFAGTSATVGAQTFTGATFDNRPAYVSMIACAPVVR
jgi:hypothetical protein